MLSRFVSSMFKPKNKYSLEMLQYYQQQLQRNPVMTDKNREIIIETLRSLAELLIWGDQNSEAFFEFFLEKNMMAFFFNILNQRTAAAVKVQLLQTLSILIENIQSEHAIYFLLSNNRINEIIVYDFDFSNEEVLAYYVSFLKALSLKLNPATVNFFFNAEARDFPLYTEAVKFFRHPEPMIVIAVRTLTLNIYRIPNEDLRRFVLDSASVPYLPNLVHFIASQIGALDELLQAESKGAAARSGGAVESLLDHLFYVHDIFDLRIESLNAALSQHLMTKLVAPLRDAVLAGESPPSQEQQSQSDQQQQQQQQPQGQDDAAGDGGVLRPAVGLYMLAQMFQLFTWPPFVNAMAEALLLGTGPGPSPFVCALHGLLGAAAGDRLALPALLLLNALYRNRAVDPGVLFRAQMGTARIIRGRSLVGALTGGGGDSDDAGSADGSFLTACTGLTHVTATTANESVDAGRHRRTGSQTPVLLPAGWDPLRRRAGEADDGSGSPGAAGTPVGPLRSEEPSVDESAVAVAAAVAAAVTAAAAAVEPAAADAAASAAASATADAAAGAAAGATADAAAGAAVGAAEGAECAPAAAAASAAAEESSDDSAAAGSAGSAGSAAAPCALSPIGRPPLALSAVSGAGLLALPTPSASTPGRSEASDAEYADAQDGGAAYAHELVLRLLLVLHHATRCRLTTAQLAVELLLELVDSPTQAAPLVLTQQHRFVLQMAHTLAAERLRCAASEMPRHLLLTFFEDEYLAAKTPVRFERLMQDPSALLPVAQTALSGLSLERRLPSGPSEAGRRAMQVVLLTRHLRRLLLGRSDGGLPWLDSPMRIEPESPLGLPGIHLHDCTIAVDGTRVIRRFLAVLPAAEEGAIVLVDHDGAQAADAVGIVRFAGSLENVELAVDGADASVLRLEGQGLARQLRKKKWRLELTFASTSFCLAARDAIEGGARQLLADKLDAVAEMVGFGRGAFAPQ